MPSERDINEATEGAETAVEVAAIRVANEIAQYEPEWPGSALWAAIERLADARAALERARLLASGTPLWVATDHNGEWTVCCDMPRPDGSGWHTGRAYGQQLESPTPPGTCRRAVLNLLPEEGENDGR